MDILLIFLLVNIKLCLHLIQDVVIDWNWILANLYTFEFMILWHQLEPFVFPDLINGISFLRVCVQNLTKQTEEIQELLNTIKIDIKENQKNLSSLQDDVAINISKIDELGLSSDDLEELRQKLNNINTQLILLDDSVQALNNYKNQLNQAILEIQTQISSIQSQPDE